MLRLLGRATSGNVQKVIFLLEELGLPYQREDYGRQFNNTGGDYLKLNPNAKVPTLVDGDTVVWESNSILRYLASKHGGGKLYPADPAARSQVERWMDWQLSALYNPYVAMFREAKKPAAERSATFAADEKDLGAQLSILEGSLAQHAHVAGKDLSLADIALAPIVARCLDYPISLPDLPKTKAWRQAMAARPAFKKATAA
ncbi:MAG TPA: glutathione S-transferase family protein [Kiloniellales bacterium]|nr:glutathione S-transferase family protein [Kiloniellales bacterium]